LKDLITQEIAENPVLEEAVEDGTQELSPEEIQALMEAERDPAEPAPADQGILDTVSEAVRQAEGTAEAEETAPAPDADAAAPAEQPATTDPFDEIDFGSFFDDYLDPGFKSPAAESVERPSFETFLSAPVTLSDHLRSQLSVLVLSGPVRDAADLIIGNLDENGYLAASLEELAVEGEHPIADLGEALKVVQSLDPAGVGARDVRECLLLQLESRNARGGLAWRIVEDHLKLVESRQHKELARLLGRPLEHIQIADHAIRTLDPRPGLRYSGPGARLVEPDIIISKDGDEYIIELNDDDLPQLRLNRDYRKMLSRDQEPNKDVRNYVKERYASAIQLMKNIEQRKQTIVKVCHAIIRRQTDFLDKGIDSLKPMMIKDVAEEIGVHPSTVSRAVAGKYANTPQGVFELRYFFSEAVQGPSGGGTPLLLLKRRVKKMIAEEDSTHPLTDEQITAQLQREGIHVTRRTVAKYREDMKIPSTHHRRVRE
ncbi:MAG TPA: RNA polymerase factor sigma-54, partial [Bryobacteraceae bacterium]|nr:RNA polymerase factor sigma-54 [Bryobacteraceae bacterium]